MIDIREAAGSYGSLLGTGLFTVIKLRYDAKKVSDSKREVPRPG
jgi:hypothetical protein